MYRMGLVVALSCVAWGTAFSKPRAVSEPHPAPVAIGALFEPETLNSSLEWIENRLGAAKYINGDNRIYIVNGCKVVVGYVKNAVRNIGIEGLSERCTFDLKRFYPRAKIGQAASLTFGALDDALGGNSQPLPECLASCGNSAEPAINVLQTGSHADNFISVLASNDYPYRGAQADKALTALMKRMSADHGVDYLAEGKGDCDRSYSPIERTLSRDAMIKTLRVGWDFDENPARCPTR